jgi:pyruvate,water dikinase
MLIPFTTAAPASTGAVGGKAASLIRLRQNGFPVPDGFVLTTEFFGPWLDVVTQTIEWRNVAAVMNRIGRSQPDLETREALNAACVRVKALAGQLVLAPEQREALRALDSLAGPYAVRSSSPEEDLGGASFAGQYESLLGVQTDAIDDAIRHCFASCLDARVLLYKKAMEFDGLAPSIAVAVQQMVASDIAGVAFSINPLTNDFDEVLINASWGIGEALVSGDITPDSVVVNKINGEIIEHRAGDKGGDRSDETCLDDAQIAQLVDAVLRIEALYCDPVDVEWAFADGHLHVLQARPITSYVPLAERLQTKPGEPRHLYFDGYLTDGITMSSGTSPMADDMFHFVMSAMIEWMVVPPERQHLDDFGMHMQGTGRFYIDLSLYLNFVKPEVMRLKADAMNPAMAAMLTSPELLTYKLAALPAHLRPWKLYLHAIPALWRMRRALTVVIKVLIKGADFLPEANAIIAKFNDYMARPIDHDRPLQATLKEELIRAGQTIIESSYPGFMLFFLDTTARLPKLIDAADPEQLALADDMQSGYVDDMVVKMGHRIFDMSRLLTNVQLQDLDALCVQVRDRTLSDEFMHAWD